MKIKWQDLMPTARAIVNAEKALYPHGEGVVAFGAGGTDGTFSRHGTGTHDAFWSSLPGNLSTLINQNTQQTTISPGLASQQSGEYGRLMTDTPEAQPGFSSLVKAANVDPTQYAGKQPLQNIASRDPYSSQFEDSTARAYEQRAGDALAQVATGPDAVRGGDARTSIMQGVTADQLARGRGMEVRQAQLQDVGNVSGAAQAMAGIEQAKTNTGVAAAGGLTQLASGVAQRGLGAAEGVDRTKDINLKLLQLAAGLQGVQRNTQSDAFDGQGYQSGWQGGMSCCFIFNEALNGELPLGMELARIEYYTPRREQGYKWLAAWLVPAMRKHTAMRRVVNTVLIKPFLRYSEWLYGDGKSVSALYAPYCHSWLTLWGLIGTLKGK